LKGAVRVIALFESFKGLVVLLAATGVLALVPQDLAAAAIKLVEHAHLDPASRYPGISITAASNLQNTRLTLLAFGAAAYPALRFIEAYGLLRGRAWAEVLAAGSGAVYVPFELLGFAHRPTPLHAIFCLPMRWWFWSWFPPSCNAARAPSRMPPDPSIDRTSSGKLRSPAAAADFER
jgi:uncharacterized membrane protein (DUF2068 family)